VPSQRGITGIETAIIVISFIVVASVFAFAAIYPGFFAAEEGKKTILGGLNKAESSILVRGGVTATRGGVDGDGDNTLLITSTSTDEYAIATVDFLVTTALASGDIDLTPPYTSDAAGTDPDASGLESPTIARFLTENVILNNAAWTVSFIGSNDGDYILEGTEKAEVTVWLQQEDVTNSLWDLGTDSSNPFIDSATELFRTRSEFSLQITAGGAVLTVAKTSPSSLDLVMLLQ
jgi:flagellin-like protein